MQHQHPGGLPGFETRAAGAHGRQHTGQRQYTSGDNANAYQYQQAHCYPQQAADLSGNPCAIHRHKSSGSRGAGKACVYKKSRWIDKRGISVSVELKYAQHKYDQEYQQLRQIESRYLPFQPANAPF
jgi:hypothetical protein